MILFLYTELAGYVLAALRETAKLVPVFVVHWPVNKEAPFQLEKPENAVFIEKKVDISAEDSGFAIDRVQYEYAAFKLVVCSGWIDKDYIRLCRMFRNRSIPTVLTMDNHWTGSLKQRLLTWISPVFLKRIFDYCWVPGEPQKNYALKLHFKPEQIKTGFYTADTSLFNGYHQKHCLQKRLAFPRRFICVARYIPQKNLELLWEAFIEAVGMTGSNWELWNLGFGEDFEGRTRHPHIVHHGFVQPGDIDPFIEKTGVFVLPSLNEPWGVAVHEFAAAGFPLILSDKIGAATQFLKEGYNGFTFNPLEKETLVNLFIKVMRMDDGELVAMGERSHELAQQITPKSWAATAMEMMNK